MQFNGNEGNLQQSSGPESLMALMAWAHLSIVPAYRNWVRSLSYLVRGVVFGVRLPIWADVQI